MDHDQQQEKERASELEAQTVKKHPSNSTPPYPGSKWQKRKQKPLTRRRSGAQVPVQAQTEIGLRWGLQSHTPSFLLISRKVRRTYTSIFSTLKLTGKLGPQIPLILTFITVLFTFWFWNRVLQRWAKNAPMNRIGFKNQSCAIKIYYSKIPAIKILLLMFFFGHAVTSWIFGNGCVFWVVSSLSFWPVIKFKFLDLSLSL